MSGVGSTSSSAGAPSKQPPSRGASPSPSSRRQLACDPCRHRKVRCVRTESERCVACTDRDVECTTTRIHPVQRRERTGRRIEEARARFGGEPSSSLAPPPASPQPPRSTLTPTSFSLPPISTDRLPAAAQPVRASTAPDAWAAATLIDTPPPASPFCESPSSAAAPAWQHDPYDRSRGSKGSLASILNSPSPPPEPTPRREEDEDDPPTGQT